MIGLCLVMLFISEYRVTIPEIVEELAGGRAEGEAASSMVQHMPVRRRTTCL